MRRFISLGMLATGAGAVAISLWATRAGNGDSAAVKAAAAPSSTSTAAKALSCAKNPGTTAKAGRVSSNPQARKAAHRGLRYLTESSKAWTEKHNCFGCHVQAVTLEALALGKHHRYDIGDDDINAMTGALMKGVTAGGRVTGAAFQGQAWARYDELVRGDHTKELLRYAEELKGLQRDDGSIPDDDARLPITGGTMHTTYQSMQTWRQAYARTADEKWLSPLRRAEKYLARVSDSWKPDANVYIQEINLALLGLVAAGVGPAEPSSRRLQKLLLARQNKDGGWGLEGLETPKSDALATGQTMHTLKLAGFTDADKVIERGTHWLIEHQQKDGAWRTVHSGKKGAEKGEGMWAVLGLVTMDVITVSVSGLTDGQHVGGAMNLQAIAHSNDRKGGQVTKIELFVDDLPAGGACSSVMKQTWNTSALSEGKHIVDIVATNSKGQETRRRFEVYAGNVFLTNVGAAYDARRGASELSVRNIAPNAKAAGTITLNVFAVRGKDNKRGKKVYSTTEAGKQGAMSFLWKGVGTNGKAQKAGRYIAEFVMRDGAGKAVQRESLLFSHESEADQYKNWAQVQGRLSIQNGKDNAANTIVELVDEKGTVVQTVRSTAQGNYRFKSVSKGKYRVRARKRGWKSQETAVEATPNAPASTADMDM